MSQQEGATTRDPGPEVTTPRDLYTLPLPICIQHLIRNTEGAGEMDQALRCISAGATFVLHTTPTARREEERRHEDQNKLSGFRCPCTDPHLPHHQRVPESGDGIPKISLCSTRSRDLKLQRLSEGHREFKVLSGSVTLYCCFQSVLQIWPWFVRAIGLD
ncbi:hypothetical protein NA56DRAFT_703618 [Hyaloscypha hepaticicola]|uniref:Uncharacterized protein n=1 Tax=Hyaloscypha hepaticicola TaxID=2082293 RepID=A0A2J6Q572_9HELO|nr:hypothetical protein NA56DRAFT_703618 [Hyaloscypha hepaticicola]